MFRDFSFERDSQFSFPFVILEKPRCGWTCHPCRGPLDQQLRDLLVSVFDHLITGSWHQVPDLRCSEVILVHLPCHGSWRKPAYTLRASLHQTMVLDACDRLCRIVLSCRSLAGSDGLGRTTGPCTDQHGSPLPLRPCDGRSSEFGQQRGRDRDQHLRASYGSSFGRCAWTLNGFAGCGHGSCGTPRTNPLLHVAAGQGRIIRAKALRAHSLGFLPTSIP